MIRDFLKTHGNGFWLHTLVAVAVMVLAIGGGNPKSGLAFNLVFWPAREFWQKRHAPRNFFTFHVFLEWGCPVLAALLIYGGFHGLY